MINMQSAVIAHQYPLDRLALRDIILQKNRQIRISEVISLTELERLLLVNPTIDLLLFDLSLLQDQCPEKLKQLKARHPDIRIITISRQHHNYSQKTLRSPGIATNITSKDSISTVSHVLDTVARGQHWFRSNHEQPGAVDKEDIAQLSRQEWRVVDKLVMGLMNEQIADELKISANTAKAHVRSILRKWGIKTRTQAVLIHSKHKLNSKQKDCRPDS